MDKHYRCPISREYSVIKTESLRDALYYLRGYQRELESAGYERTPTMIDILIESIDTQISVCQKALQLQLTAELAAVTLAEAAEDAAGRV